MKIALDIGHSNNTGAQGNGLEEHNQAQGIATLVASKLETLGHNVDIIDYPALSNKADLNATITHTNKGDYTLGISIHCDASDNPNARGAHICYASNKGLFLATLIAGPLCNLLPGRSRKTIRRTDLAILTKTKPVWALVECGFITNAPDAKIIDKHKDVIAQAIADGIIDYLSNQP